MRLKEALASVTPDVARKKIKLDIAIACTISALLIGYGLVELAIYLFTGTTFLKFENAVIIWIVSMILICAMAPIGYREYKGLWKEFVH